MNDFFRVLFTPSVWHQMYPYSSLWDKYLSDLLEKHDFECVTKHTAKIGGITVWIANYPHTCFFPYESEEIRVRAKRLTILRANDKLTRVVGPESDEVRLEKLIATTATEKADLSIVN